MPSSAPTSGIKGANGDIFTGFYKNFQSLSDDEKQAIFDERKGININPKKSCGNHSKEGQTSAIKINKNSVKDDQRNFFYEGQVQGHGKVQESIQRR
jgi:hypothetical protein